MSPTVLTLTHTHVADSVTYCAYFISNQMFYWLYLCSFIKCLRGKLFSNYQGWRSVIECVASLEETTRSSEELFALFDVLRDKVDMFIWTQVFSCVTIRKQGINLTRKTHYYWAMHIFFSIYFNKLQHMHKYIHIYIYIYIYEHLINNF